MSRPELIFGQANPLFITSRETKSPAEEIVKYLEAHRQAFLDMIQAKFGLTDIEAEDVIQETALKLTEFYGRISPDVETDKKDEKYRDIIVRIMFRIASLRPETPGTEQNIPIQRTMSENSLRMASGTDQFRTIEIQEALPKIKSLLKQHSNINNTKWEIFKAFYLEQKTIREIATQREVEIQKINNTLRTIRNILKRELNLEL